MLPFWGEGVEKICTWWQTSENTCSCGEKHFPKNEGCTKCTKGEKEKLMYKT